MPDDKSVGVTMEDYQKDQDEFENATDILLAADDDKSDDDLNKELDEKLGTETDTAGEATKDQSTTPDDGAKPKEDDIFADGQKPDDDAAAADAAAAAEAAATKKDKDVPDDTTIDWKARAETAEAELKKEQQKTSSWDGRIKAANTKAGDLATENEKLKLEIAKQPDPEAESDKEKLDKFKKDFPELADVMDVYDKRTAAVKVKEPVNAEVVVNDEGSSGDSTVADESKDNNVHMKDIHDVHPDLAEMVNSGVLLTWIQKQKPFMRPHLEHIYYKGESSQVIDVCTQFKESTGWKSQLANQDSEKEKTKQEKLDALKEVNSESGGAPPDGPDMNDYDKGAKDAGL
jgi:hypothetical protein